MKTISIDLPDKQAERIEAASDREKLVWAFRLAAIVKEDSPSDELRSMLSEIEAWQTSNHVVQDDFDQLFSELSRED